MAHRDSRARIAGSWLVLALLAAHDLSHLLDDGLDTPPAELAYVSVPQWLLLAAAMAVILGRDAARSRLAAMLLGGSVAVGFAAVHLLPVSPAAFWDLHPSAISWLLVWVPLVAALVLAVLAWRSSPRS